MSGKRGCKRNICNRGNEEFCGINQGCGFERGCDDRGCAWGEETCCEEKYKADKNCFNAANCKDHDRACDERNCKKEHVQCSTDGHKLNKECETKHKQCDRKACKEVDNCCNSDHSRRNNKYLVDKLYIYEHHRVIDLNCCENDRKHSQAHKDFKDLECAIEDFKEADVCVRDFCDENRKDFEAYEAARAKTRDLQNCKKNGSKAFVWSSK
jgi:hypothetical protein